MIMLRRFIGLFIPITNDEVSDPEMMRPITTCVAYQLTSSQIACVFV